MASRFAWVAFRGRVRTRMVMGVALLTLALGYGTWATNRLAYRGSERSTFDQPVVEAAGRVVRRPDRIPDLPTRTTTELELSAVARDQQDMLFGLTVLLARLLVAAPVAGLGLVLLTAGATEWEVRSEHAAEPAAR